MPIRYLSGLALVCALPAQAEITFLPRPGAFDFLPVTQ